MKRGGVYKQVALSATAEEAVAHLTRGINTYHDEEVTVAELYGRRASFHFENRDWSAAVADYPEASGVLRRTDQRPQVRNNPKLEFFGKFSVSQFGVCKKYVGKANDTVGACEGRPRDAIPDFLGLRPIAP